MERKLFYDDETIVGYSDDIIEDLKENGDDEDESIQELIDDLSKYDYELVICRYHPMGAWFVSRLIEEGTSNNA